MSRVKAAASRRSRLAPMARGALAAARRVHARYLHRSQLRALTWLRVGRKHAAPIDPLTNLWIDPAAVATFLDLRRDEYMKMRFVFDVVGGDWDLRAKPIEEHFIYASFADHFDRGVPWEETRLYSTAVDGIRTGSWRYHGCRDASQVLARLAEVDLLYERMSRDGYRSQSDLTAGAADGPLSRRRSRPPELDEIVVNIDRHGGFVFVDGIHRLAVAKLVGVPALPVCVLVRHEAWQAQRDRIAREATPSAATATDHPDIAILRRR